MLFLKNWKNYYANIKHKVDKRNQDHQQLEVLSTLSKERRQLKTVIEPSQEIVKRDRGRPRKQESEEGQYASNRKDEKQDDEFIPSSSSEESGRVEGNKEGSLKANKSRKIRKEGREPSKKGK